MKHSAGPTDGSPNKHTEPEFGRFVPAKNNLCDFGQIRGARSKEMLRYCFGRNIFDYRFILK